MEVKTTPEFEEDMERLFVDKISSKLYRIWDAIKGFPREVKWFFQRGKRGYADCDVWSIDSYILRWLPDAIEQLRDNQNGYPGIEGASTPEEWERVLTKLAQDLRTVRTNAYDKTYLKNGEDGKQVIDKEECDKDKRFEQETFMTLCKWFFCLWD